jgi:hypothetical protein
MIPPETCGLLVGGDVGNVVFFPALDLLFEVDFGFFAYFRRAMNCQLQLFDDTMWKTNK